MHHLGFLSFILALIFFLSVAASSAIAQSLHDFQKFENHSYKISVENTTTSFQVKYDGEVAVSNDKDVMVMSEGSSCCPNKKSFGSKYQAHICEDGRQQLTTKERCILVSNFECSRPPINCRIAPITPFVIK